MSFGTVGFVAVFLLMSSGVVRADSDAIPSVALGDSTYNMYRMSSENLRVAQPLRRPS